MKIQELRNLSKDELIQKEKSLLEELYKMNQQRYGQRVEKPHNFLLLKKDIARIQTILSGLASKQRADNTAGANANREQIAKNG